jgi:hypothetical protein
MAKLAATYWVGLLRFDTAKFDIAEDWLRNPGLGDAESPWSSGARYNLARALEAQNKFDEAAQLLETDSSPQRHGNRLRARALREKSEKGTTEGAKSEESQ